jgi:hypothetical protein
VFGGVPLQLCEWLCMTTPAFPVMRREICRMPWKRGWAGCERTVVAGEGVRP